MLALTQIVAAFRRSRMRRAAIRDLKSLSREQLSDVGIPEDRLGDVIDDMLARQQPFDVSALITSSAKDQQHAGVRPSPPRSAASAGLGA